MEPAALDPLCARLCRRLISHDIYLDAPAITLLGSGDLGIDLRFGNCRFEDRFIPPLLLVARLRDELRVSLEGDPEDPIRLAELRLAIKLSPQKGSRNSKMTWIMAGEDFVACTFQGEVQVSTAMATGKATVTTTIDWPLECAKWVLPEPPAGRGRVSKWFRTI